MVEDLVPGLLKAIEEDVEKLLGSSDVIKEAFQALKDKKATYETAHAFAIEIGEILSEALGAHLRGENLPDGKLYYNMARRLLEDTLGANFERIAGYSGQVQKILNQEAKIGLKVQKAKFPQDRIDGFVNRLASEEQFEDVRWLLESPIVTFCQSVVDDTIKVNAAFHAKAGLSPKIVRKMSGRACSWCLALVGTYAYGSEPKDVYRRHENCRCVVDYYLGDGKKQNVWSRKVTKASKNELKQRKQVNLDIRDNNRKADSKEYKEIITVLGAEKAPISLAKFQDLKYNDGERYEQLKDKVFIHQKLKNGEWGTRINLDKQLPHMESTRKPGKSYLYDSVDVQKLFDTYYGTGRLEVDRYGRRTNVEYIITDTDIGVAVSKNGQVATDEMKIHHSKKRTHISPVKKGGIS